MSGLIPIEQTIMQLSDGAKRDHREVLIDYLVGEPGSVELTEYQKALLQRLEFADDQLRLNRFKAKEVMRLVMKKFELRSPASAWKVLNDAKYVFGSMEESNKKYLLARHADRIEFAMQECLKTGDMKAYAALCQQYTNAVKEMPNDARVRKQAPRPIFLIQKNDFTILTGKEADAARARKLTKQYLTDIEIVDDGTDGDQ